MNYQSPLLHRKAASMYVGLSLASLQRAHSEGWGPKAVHISKRRVLYRREDLDAWIASRVASSTAEARERGLSAA